MNSSRENQMDPALEELFRELANDPRSTLLRVPTKRGVVRGEREVGGCAAGLLAAERELLGVFRHELRDLLLEGCRRELYRLSGLHISRWSSFNERQPVSSEEDWRACASRTLNDVPEEIEARDALNLLSACVVQPQAPPPTVSQLAGAAQRVLLDDRARVYAALELLGEESPRAAMSLLNGVLEDDAERGVRSYCWQNLGACQHRLGDLTAALESHERSLIEGEARPAPLLSVFFIALAVEDGARAQRYAAEIDDLMEADHPCLGEEVELLRQLTATEDAATKITRTKTYQEIEDRLGAVSRRIGNALIE